LIRLYIANTNQSYMVSIKEEVRSRQQLSKGWDLVGKGGKTVTEEFVNNAGAPEVRPVSTARPKMHAQRPRSAWTSSPEPTQHDGGIPPNHHFPRQFDGGDEMDQSRVEGFAAALAKANARSAADTAGTGIGLDSDYADSLANEDELPDGFFDDAAKHAPQQQQQQLPTIPTVQAHISFQNDFWEQMAKMDKERKAFEAETLKRQLNSDNEVAAIRRDAAQATEDAQKMTAKVLEQLGHAQSNFEATLRRAEELRVLDQRAAAEAVAAAATASAAAVTAAATAAAAVAEKQNRLIATILERLENPVEPAKRPESDDAPPAKRHEISAGSAN
jgi:hypothetical protein